VELGKIKKTRTGRAEDLARRINSQLTSNEKGHDFSKVHRYADAKEWLKMANRYHAENPKVKALNESLDEHIAKGMQDFYAEVDKRKWDKHAANAPSNANQLAKAALDWFKNSPDWGQRSKAVRKPLGVTVTGPWSVQKKNLLGEPICTVCQ